MMKIYIEPKLNKMMKTITYKTLNVFKIMFGWILFTSERSLKQGV